MRSYARYLLNNIGKGGAISHCLNQMRALETLKEMYRTDTKDDYCPLCVCCTPQEDYDDDYDCRLCIWAAGEHDLHDPDENEDNYDEYFYNACLKSFRRSFFHGEDDDQEAFERRLNLFPIQMRYLEGVLAHVTRG